MTNGSFGPVPDVEGVVTRYNTVPRPGGRSDIDLPFTELDIVSYRIQRRLSGSKSPGLYYDRLP